MGGGQQLHNRMEWSGTLKTITVSNQKGGVGKTTISLLLAMALREAGKKVLFIDIDPQGNASKTLNKFSSDVSATSFFTDQPGNVVALEGITLIKSDPKLADLERANPQIINLFRKNLKNVTDFDFCVIDTPPVLGLRMTAALVSADYVLAPIQLEEYSIDGLKMMLQTIFGVKQKFNPDLVFLGMLANQFNSRSAAQKETFMQLVKNYSDLIIPAKIGDRSSIPEGIREGLPVWEVKKSAAREASREVKEVFDFIFKKLGVENA